MSNLIVYKANELVVSRYDLTEQETRLILFGISKLNPTIKKPTKEDRTVRISCDEYAEVLGISLQLAWHNLNNAVTELMQRSIEIFNPYPNSGISKIIFQWVNVAKFHSHTQEVELTFSDEIQPYLFNMQRFISYKLQSINSLNNRYSIKLYEWLLQELGKSGANEKITTIELTFFKKLLDLEDSYPVFKEFNRTVLKPILNDLNNNSDLKVQIKALGRPTDTLQFSIQKQNKQLDLVNAIAEKEQSEKKVSARRKTQKERNNEIRFKSVGAMLDTHQLALIALSDKELKFLKSAKKQYEQKRDYDDFTESQLAFLDGMIAKYRPKV